MGDIRQQDKAEYRRLLEDIGSDYCKTGCYCIFKEFLIASHPSRRMLIQLKMVDRIKYEKSEKAGKDIGWDGAFKIWMDEKYADKFALVYADDKSPKDIYHALMKVETS